jgi:glycosyltransferase involved in cell wall biosynthesis
MLAELSPRLALGFARLPINRQLSFSDVGVVRSVAQRIETVAPDVLHGHGAKGAALVRLAPNVGHAVRAYTPHGGSLIYSPGTLSGKFYRSLEWVLNWRTDLFLFESSYVADLFRAEIGRPDATDLVCVGELRPVKAIDVLIEALAILKQSGRRVSVTIAGEGPEGPKLQAQTERLGVADQVHFIGHCPARKAFTLGRVFVIPSRAESLPYVVLEAAAAGMPIIATAVGGIPEIFGAEAPHLIAPNNVAALVSAIRTTLDDPAQAHLVAQSINTRVRSEFSLNSMVEGGIAAYREALAMRKLAQFT